MKSRLSAFTLVEIILVVAILIVFLAILIPQYNAYRSRLALKTAAQSVKSDITRAIALAKNSSSGTISTSSEPPGALAVIQPANYNLAGQTGGVISIDTIPSNFAISGTPALFSVNGCTGAAAVQFPGGTLGLLFSPRGSLLTCAGGAQTTVTTNALVCGGATFPIGSSIQQIQIADTNNNTAAMCIDTRTGSIIGP